MMSVISEPTTKYQFFEKSLKLPRPSPLDRDFSSPEEKSNGVFMKFAYEISLAKPVFISFSKKMTVVFSLI